MSFIRYPSIENSYQIGTIRRWTDEFPELKDCDYTIQEKIHGANIQLRFQNGKMTVGSRNNYKNPDCDKFFDVWNVLDKIKDIVEQLENCSIFFDEVITLYGELFGGTIQKEVDYGPIQRILFYDVSYDGILQSPWEFEEFVTTYRLCDHCLPAMDITSGLSAALQSPENFRTAFCPHRLRKRLASEWVNVPENFAEGIVIKPYREVYVSNNGHTFMVKKKGEKFCEKFGLKFKKQTQAPEDIENLRDEMKALATEARLLNLFTKIGKIEETKQIGDYIGAFVSDCTEEFLREHGDEFEKLDPKSKKYVLKIGHLVVPLLKKHLEF